MCGRFMLDSDIADLFRQYRVINKEVDDYKKGNIYPSQNVPIVIDDKGRALKSAKWGFSLSGKSNLVINARSESIVGFIIFGIIMYRSKRNNKKES